jgi:hypothetical protein
MTTVQPYKPFTNLYRSVGQIARAMGRNEMIVFKM